MFSFPRGTEMFQFPRCPPRGLCIPPPVSSHHEREVPPFGHPRIPACVRLPGAFRCSPRPSSAPSAKASSVRPVFLILLPSGPAPARRSLAHRRAHTPARTALLLSRFSCQGPQAPRSSGPAPRALARPETGPLPDPSKLNPYSSPPPSHSPTPVPRRQALLRAGSPAPVPLERR